MQTMICEICGSNALVKEHGLYVCRYCQSKYSLEEARKLLQSDPPGEPEDGQKLRLLARRAMEAGQGHRAKRYYELALLKDPDLWDPWFYSVYFEAQNCRLNEIAEMAERLYDCQELVLRLISDHVTDPKEERAALEELSHRTIEVAKRLFYSSKSAHYDQVVRDRIFENAKFVVEGTCCRDALYHLGDLLSFVFKERHSDLAALCWEEGTKQHALLHPSLQDKRASEQKIFSYGRKIRKYNPRYTAPKLKKGGCYVATAVYGSYDCPQVWVLRRYRDDKLAKTTFGRLFIRSYYALSPTLVRLFGAQSWFRRLLKPRLDRLVSRLQKEGVADTPYEDS